MRIGDMVSDSDIGGEIATTPLRAISCYRNGPGYTLVMVDDYGNMSAYTVTEERLTHAFITIGAVLTDS